MLQQASRAIHLTNVLLCVYCGLAFLALFWPASAWLLALAVWLSIRQRRRGRRTDLGSATLASESDLERAGMLDAPNGLILGRLPRQTRRGGTSVRHRDPLVRLHQAVHTVICGPTGSGKGVSFVLPTLLTSPESCVVLDYKGELARQAAEHRRKRFGHRVVILDPYGQVTGQPDAFNPLDFIRKGDPLAIDDCNDIAASLVVRTGNEKERHWDDSAEACIAAVAATVVTYGGPKTRSLQNVREILSNPNAFEMGMRLMTESDAWDGALARMGGQLLHFADREKASVLSTALRHLRFLGSPAVSACTSTSTFDPADLRRGRLTVFCVIPPDRAQASSGLIRLWVGSMLRACVRGGLQ